MMFHRRLVIGAAALLLTLGVAEAKPLVHAIPADIASLDPADIRGQQDQEIGVNVYERLVRMKFNEQKDGTLMADPVEVVPELAESWTVDGPAITFKLRPGVKFYPTGNPMTAEDVRYSFERLTRIVGNGRNQAGIAGLFKAEQVEVVDPMTVKITFTDGNGVPTAIPVALTSMKFQQFAVIDSVEVKKHVTAEDPWANEWLKKNLATRSPQRIDVVALLRKPEAVKVEVEVGYVGFDIPTEFVVGYGLDYAERYRDLPWVGLLAEHMYR